MIKFRQKDFGFIDSAISGTSTGAQLGGVIGGLTRLDSPAKWLGLSKGLEGYKHGQRVLAGAITGAVIGASLGILAEGIKKISTNINRRNTVDNRLLKVVVENLQKLGFKEGEKFTRDPKTASELRIKICISVARVNGDLRLLVNTIKDPKLKDLSETMISRLPNSSVVRQDMKDKFNEISITSISDSSADSGLITGIAEYFIRNGYPVYLVEVG